MVRTSQPPARSELDSGQYPANAAQSLHDWLVGHVPPLPRSPLQTHSQHAHSSSYSQCRTRFDTSLKDVDDVSDGYFQRRVPLLLPNPSRSITLLNLCATRRCWRGKHTRLQRRISVPPSTFACIPAIIYSVSLKVIWRLVSAPGVR